MDYGEHCIDVWALMLTNIVCCECKEKNSGKAT